MAIFSLISYAASFAGGYLSAIAGFSLQTSVAIGNAVGALATAAAYSAVSRLLTPKINIPQSEIQAVINQSDAPRRIYVGENLVGGVRAFFDVRSNILHQLVVVAHGQITSFLEFWIDSIPVTITPEGSVDSGKQKGHVSFLTRDGSADGGDYAGLINGFTTWDSTRRLTGQATFLASMEAMRGDEFSKVFPKAYNTVLQCRIRGQAIYDPRTDETVYGDNAALVFAHFLTHADGYGLAFDEVDWDSVSAMADVADFQIPQRGGGTQPSLRLWGYWTLDESPVNVLDRMHSSSGIRAYEMQDGRIGLIGGSFGETACTLTAKDIKQIQTAEAISEREGYNVLRVFHLDASLKYEVTEVDAWRDEDRLAIEGEVVKEYRLDMCPNRSQARRLGKQQIYNDNRAKVEIITNLVGLKARFPAQDGQRHTILLDYRPEDGSGRVIAGEYEVKNHEFDPVELECRIELERVDRASDTWSAVEEGDPPTPLPDVDGNFAPPISAVFTQRIIQVSASARQAVLEVDAVPIPDRDDIEVQARYRRVGSTQWIAMQATSFSAQSGAVEDGVEYEAEARFNGIFDAVDLYEDLGTITVQIDATAPDSPTDLIPSNSGGAVHLSWRNPNGSFFAIRIYRSTGTDFASASLVGQTGGTSGQISEFSDDSISPATTYNYWVAAVNVSGVESAPAGPANITTP